MGKVVANSHCHYCGNEFSRIYLGKNALYCEYCRNWTHLNASPVAVLLIAAPEGLYGLRRGTEPQKGHAALPGGYIEQGEDWRVAAAREAFEELQIIIPSPKTTVKEFGFESNPSGQHVLLFGIVPIETAIHIQPFMPSEEALERLVITPTFKEGLAFPLHEKMVAQYYSEM